MLSRVLLGVLALATAGAMPARAEREPGGAGRLWLYNVHTREELRVAAFDGTGRLRPGAWRRLNRFFRSWRTHRRRPVHPRLLRTLAHVQRHFGGHRLEIVSGFRVPEDRRERSSYHQVGRAADVRIPGVAERALFDYCRTLAAVGCGYYPNGHHVHIDVRGTAGLWVDLSPPGDGRARYVPAPARWLAGHED